MAAALRHVRPTMFIPRAGGRHLNQVPLPGPRLRVLQHEEQLLRVREPLVRRIPAQLMKPQQTIDDSTGLDLSQNAIGSLPMRPALTPPLPAMLPQATARRAAEPGLLELGDLAGADEPAHPHVGARLGVDGDGVAVEGLDGRVTHTAGRLGRPQALGLGRQLAETDE
ncbi:hypothetical protein [Streptomyces sp. NPDC050287]|uniref:hypothetical protein n=1 Tax=Streptomyces sp. NPDC050287 TaxID=3365608 RepID=UPI0037B49953